MQSTELEKRTETILKKYGIRYRFFVLFAVLVIIPFLAIAALASAVFRNNVVDNYGSNMADTMVAVSKQVKILMKKYEEATMNLYYGGAVNILPKIPEDDLIISSLESICFSNSDVLSAYLVCNNQVYTAGLSNSVDIRQVVEQHEEEILRAKGKSRWFRTDALFGQSGSQRYLLMRSLNSVEASNVGTLCLVFDEKLFSKPLSGLSAKGVERYVLDSDGKIFYSMELEDIGTEFSAENFVLGEKTVYGSCNFKGQEVIFASCALDSPKLYFVSICPVSDILEPVAKLRVATVFTCLIYLAFLFSMLFLLNHYIFHPISDLSQKMDVFARGDLNTRAELHSMGEIQSLNQHFNQMTEEINHLMVRNEKSLKEKSELEMKALTAQIKPHFIYNALNTIKWMAVINKQENIQKMVESLVGILMNAARIDDADYTLKEEITLIENYARIQKARFMNFDMDVILDIEPERYKIRKFLLQPVVENAIIHGFARGKHHGHIRMRIWEDGRLYIKVEDNGVGFDVESWRSGDERQKNHTNIGLRNIEQLIHLEYGDEYGLKITSEPGKGTTVEYLLPLIER